MSHLDSSDEECHNINYKLYERIKKDKYCNNNYCNESSSDSDDNNSSCCESIYAIDCKSDNGLNLGQVLYYDGKDIAGSNNFKYDASANEVIIDGKLTVTGIQLIPQYSNPFSNVSGILWYNKNNNLFYIDNTPINNT